MAPWRRHDDVSDAPPGTTPPATTPGLVVTEERLPDGRRITYFGISAVSERRYDPTHDEWVTFATNRQDRTYKPPTAACPLCPTRPDGPETEIPREHFEIAVFDNRFPSLAPTPPDPDIAGTDLVPVEPAYGHCEVVVFTDDHEATLASVGVARIRLLVDAWAHRFDALARGPPRRLRAALREQGRGGRRDAAPPPRPNLRLPRRAAPARPRAAGRRAAPRPDRTLRVL